MNSLTKSLYAKLGRCPRCMRSSFAAAVIAWACTLIAARALAWPAIEIALAGAAAGLTVLWFAHFAAFAHRATREAARHPRDKVDGEAGDAVPSRRRAFTIFAGRSSWRPRGRPVSKQD